MTEYSREQRIADLLKRLNVYRERCRDLDCENLALRLQLSKSQWHLFTILDGKDREKAIEDARVWLKVFCARKGGYDLISQIVNEIVPDALRRVKEGQNESL